MQLIIVEKYSLVAASQFVRLANQNMLACQETRILSCHNCTQLSL